MWGNVNDVAERHHTKYAYPLAVWAPWSMGPPPIVFEEGTPMDMPVIAVFELDLRGWK